MSTVTAGSPMAGIPINLVQGLLRLGLNKDLIVLSSDSQLTVLMTHLVMSNLRIYTSKPDFVSLASCEK